MVSVHLKLGGGRKDKARRKRELGGIAAWIDEHDDTEKGFIVLGDMNIEDRGELAEATPTGFLSLNDECCATNTNVRGPKPHDHVMFSVEHTNEIDREYDLVEAVRGAWTLIVRRVLVAFPDCVPQTLRPGERDLECSTA